MDRRTFCGVGAATAVVGCGASDMPQEFTLQPSPLRTGHLVGSPVPGYAEYVAPSTACTGAIDANSIWQVIRSGNLVVWHVIYTTSTLNTAALPSFDFGVLLPEQFRPNVNTTFPVPIVDNGVLLDAPGWLLVDTSGLLRVLKDQSATAFTAGTEAGINATAVCWTTAKGVF